MIHIVIGDSAAGSMKLALKNTLQSYIVLPPYFGEGPIQHLLTNEGLSARVEWFEKNYQHDWAYYGDMTEMAIEAIDELEDEHVMVWVANNAAEQFGLALVCHILQHKHCKIHIMNTSENIQQLLKGQEFHYTIRSTGELSVKQLLEMKHKKMARLLTKEEIVTLAHLAERLMGGKSLLRRWEHNQIVELDEAYDDELILHYVQQVEQKNGKGQFTRAVRLIGEIFGQEEAMLSDAWIDYRIRTLAGEGKLEAVGNTKEIQLYEIRLSQHN